MHKFTRRNIMQVKHEQFWKMVAIIGWVPLLMYIILGWTGIILSNFTIFFFISSLFTGIFWIMEKAAWKNILPKDEDGDIKRPTWLEWTAGLFPMLCFLFLLRGFFVEQYKIPSGSMIPSYLVGDILLVNKTHYGTKIPLANVWLWDNNSVERGDVVVFDYPLEKTQAYIKRVIGIPGDKIEYDHVSKILKINDKVQQKSQDSAYSVTENGNTSMFISKKENLMGREHGILLSPDTMLLPQNTPFVKIGEKDCQYQSTKMICNVPKDHYFMMGDNRDNSLDSRFWGMVPKNHIVGKPFYILIDGGPDSQRK